MKKVCLLAMTMVLGLSLSAQAYFPPMTYPNQGSFGIPESDIRLVEVMIAVKLRLETGFSILQNFKVDWTHPSMTCMQTQTEMDPEAQLGVCIVTASAFQVHSKVAIVRKYEGYEVSVIVAEVE